VHENLNLKVTRFRGDLSKTSLARFVFLLKMSKLRYEIKQKIIEIAGTCFWINRNFYDFLESCGVEPDIYKKYEDQSGKYNKMRSILTDLENANCDDILKNIQSSIYNFRTIPDKKVMDVKLAEKNLFEFKELCGKDFVGEEIKNRDIISNLKKEKIKIDNKKIYFQKLEELKSEYISFFSEKNSQKRGYKLEEIVNRLFVLNEFEFQKSYKTGDEQIDGFFYLEGVHYLIETKWTKGQVGKNDMAIFDKKIDKKLQSSRGFFISINGFQQSAINDFSGCKPRLLLVDGEDLILILDNKVNLKDAIKAKINAAAKNGNIFFKIKEMI